MSTDYYEFKGPMDSIARQIVEALRDENLGRVRYRMYCGSVVTIDVKQLKPAEERCTYPIPCNGKRLKGLSMCRKHQPFVRT